MKIKFTKMHGLGNDFIVIDGVHQKINLSHEQIASLAKRHTGIGFDQCLLIEPSDYEGVDFKYRIFNADGNEVGQCGNGARCLALFAYHYGLTNKKDITVATTTTRMNLRINSDSTVSVAMGIPQLEPSYIPLVAKQQKEEYSLVLQAGQIKFHALSIGNPHAVLLVEDVEQANISILGNQISVHPNFPEQVNVGFMQIVDPGHIRLRVYERGCGETQACGSGAVAAAAVGRLFHQMNKQIKVSLLGGDLLIEWNSLNEPILLTGPAAFIYEGILF